MKDRSNRRRRPHQGDRGRAERARRQHQEQVLDDALKNTFPASDPVSIVQPAPPEADFDSVTPARNMDEREAFWAAIYKFRSPEWSSAFPRSAYVRSKRQIFYNPPSLRTCKRLYG